MVGDASSEAAHRDMGASRSSIGDASSGVSARASAPRVHTTRVSYDAHEATS